jgi:MoaA/NifB/PqqE/SkfB family radical SAM enzyme
VKLDNKEFASFYHEYLQWLKNRGINVEITNICPLECPFCPRQRPDNKERIKKSKNITKANFLKLVRFGKTFRFAGQISDPIYHPNFLEFLELTKNYPNKVFRIHTNGTRKKMDWWKKAFSMSGPNVRWTFGLDGASQEIANIYRVNTRYEEVMEVLKLGNSIGCVVVWQFIVFQHNEHQVELAKQIARENNLNILFIKSDKWPEVFVNKHKIYPPSKDWSNLKESNMEWQGQYIPPEDVGEKPKVWVKELIFVTNNDKKLR